MRNPILFILASLMLLSTRGHANGPFRFGRISASDMDLEYYREKYPGEPAIVLGDMADCKFEYCNNTYRFKFVVSRQTRIMILSEAGLDYGDFSVSFYQGPYGHEEADKIRAHIFNLQGRRVNRTRIDDRTAHISEHSNYVKEMVLALPEVRPGTVVEFSYELSSDFLFNMRSWYFQREIPVLYSEYNLDLPSIYDYRVRYRGDIPLADYEQGKSRQDFIIHADPSDKFLNYRYIKLKTRNTTHRWVAKDMPAIRPEPFTDNLENYLSMMFFEQLSFALPDLEPEYYTDTWEDVTKHFMERDDFGGYITNAKLWSDSILPEKEFASEKEAINHALNLINKTVKWNGSASRYADEEPEEIILQGTGNSAEINLMLVAILQSMGLEAYPVMASTIDNGRLFTDAPTITQWNYVLAEVNTQDSDPVLLDATVPVPVAGYLPQRLINGFGRSIDSLNNHWVNLETRINSLETKNYHLQLDASGNINGSLNYSIEGIKAYLILQQLDVLKDDELLENFTDKSGAVLSNINIKQEPGDIPILNITADMTIENYAEAIGDEMLLPALLFETEEENPFEAKERQLPINFPYNSITHVNFYLEFPEGFSVSYIPEIKSSYYGRFGHEYTIEETDTGISITGRNQNFTRTVLPENYQPFRDYMEQRSLDNQELIILRTH